MEPPSLLAPDEENDTPFLSSSGASLDAPSPFERLISQSSSPPDDSIRGALSAPMDLDPSYSRVFRQSFAAPKGIVGLSNSINDGVATSYVTLFAGSLTLLEILLVWASFLSDSWFDTYVRAPDFPIAKEKLLHSTTPASLLSALAGAEQHGAFILLLVTAVFIPCLSMILNPTWIAGDHRERLAFSPEAIGCNHQVILLAPRLVFESLLRFSLLVFFILALLNVGTSSIEVVVRDADMIVFNRIRPGLLCYVLGIISAVGTIIVLRIARYPSFNGQTSLHGHSMQSSSFHRTGTRVASGLHVPPARAFQFPWRASNTPDSTVQSQLQPLLEENNEVKHDNHQDEPQSLTNSSSVIFDDRRGMRNLQIEDDATDDNGISQRLNFCQKVILYDVGAMATILWLPALCLPLFALSYDGLASDFMPNVIHEVRLWHLPVALWAKGRTAGASNGIQVVLGTLTLTLTMIMPILANISAVAAWMKHKPVQERRLCRKFLALVSPSLCGIVLVAALFVTVPAFAPILDYVMDDYTVGFCEQIQNITGEACLTMTGRMGLGAWSLLAQAVSLELFVFLTIRWGI